jgi:gamma-glutamyl:cysteine ligase YbdK (ATP-grasp superfamily)
VPTEQGRLEEQMANTTNEAKRPMAFALAGRIVRKSTMARRILRDAIAARQDYLFPQARSVARKLQAVGQ